MEGRKKINNKKVFVVTDGDYSDYHICGVFSTRYRAKQATSKLGGSIDAWPLNEVDAGSLRLNLYCVKMTVTGDTIECSKEEQDWCNVDWARDPRVFCERDTSIIRSWALANDEKHAVKIVNERRVMAIAEGKL